MRTEDELYVETDYRILHEDENFLVVEKPAPLPVHPVGRFKEKNLLSLLRKDRAFCGAENLRIVNRLDSETSGLVLVAKSSEMAGRLGILFEKRLVTKEYHAIVFGIPETAEGTISLSLGTQIRNTHRVRVPDSQGQTAETRYKVLEKLEDYSLLQVIPHTGRTHQIRAHLAFLGNPIVGDKIYIDAEIFERYIQEGWKEDMRPVVKTERLLLHAVKLEFRHPVTGSEMKFQSKVPFSLHDFLLAKNTR